MMNINVNFNNTIRQMKPLHGINNGPISRGVSMDTSVFYKKLNPPYARLHDTHYPESREVDIHTIFPDFSKDVEDPANYKFILTDAYLLSIINIGTKVIYRLGETIASSDKKDYIAPPDDYKKYARVCVNIIRHYNEGWANGFHHNIMHWEIWNEPNVVNMWTGTQIEWLQLYKEIALAIREYDETLLIGGPAACDPDSPINIPFLKYVTENKLPLDFYTFHCYSNGSEQGNYFLSKMEKQLKEYKMNHLPAHITEWHYSPKGKNGEIFWEAMVDSNTIEKAALYAKMNSNEGASHIAMFLSILQNSFVTQANFYQASCSCKFTCFSRYGMPEKPYFALLAFKKLFDLGTQVEAVFSKEPVDVSVLASSNGKIGRILISNFNNEESEYNLNLDGDFKTIESVKVINKQMDLLPLNIKSSKGIIHKFKIPKHTVVLIEVK